MERPIDIDLSILPPPDRFEFWHDSGSQIFRPLRDECFFEPDLSVRARMLRLGEIVVGRMVSSAQGYERTEAMIRKDHVDYFHLIYFEDGEVEWDGEGGVCRVGPGDFLFLDVSQVSRHRWSAHTIMFANFPRELLEPLSVGGPSLKGGVMRASHPCAKVLSQQLKTIWECQISGMHGACRVMGLGLAELVKVYFRECYTQGSLDLAVDGNQLLLASMKNWLRQNLNRIDLSADLLAARFHLSRSSIYMLFKPDGGVKTYVQSLRLQAAYGVLQSAEGGRVSIGLLAARLGFSSISVFSRAFRERFGESPRDVKARSFEAHQRVLTETAPASQAGLMPSHWDQLAQACTAYYSTFRRY